MVVSATHIDLANFLAELYEEGASHSTINLDRSAVSAYCNVPGTAFACNYFLPSLDSKYIQLNFTFQASLV